MKGSGIRGGVLCEHYFPPSTGLVLAEHPSVFHTLIIFPRPGVSIILDGTVPASDPQGEHV
jgi:hypothetical protein